ncbi:polyphosphate polymerase domain-containing protein [uncultured Propionibacterium sp.]|uniref:polyphosphate polymerase domain-containing protein n=1 Tax=uncultured Propionibacterium sp. TaxID=218066 RepID=UPI0029306664|nr:polyphosphate polymerase domain-containing protein [uncultured Propionibacterium sp.]
MSTMVRDVRMGGFAPIGLDELNSVGALQIRIDRKYLVPPSVLARLLDGLPGRTRILMIGGRREFAYDSMYFDTDGLDSYYTAVRKRKRRWKIRERDYIDTGTNWLEVKTVRGERTVKERMQLPGTHLSQWSGAEQRTIDQALGRAGVETVPLASLHPALGTRYQRTTLFDPACGARFTLDQNLCWVDVTSGRTGRLSRTIVIETKSPGSTASAADRLLWRLSCRPVRFSKYATGMALLHPGLPHNKWHRTMGRIARDLTIEDPVFAGR